MQSKLLTEPKFVGREKELEKLEDHLKLALKGIGQTIFISGEAGTGKTRSPHYPRPLRRAGRARVHPARHVAHRRRPHPHASGPANP